MDFFRESHGMTRNRNAPLHVSIPLKRSGHSYVSAASNLLVLKKSQIKSLRYRYTTDIWKSSGEMRGRLRQDERDDPILDFDELETFPPIGRLEGFCYLRQAWKPAPRIGSHDQANIYSHSRTSTNQ
jgi:hypothetical protein